MAAGATVIPFPAGFAPGPETPRRRALPLAQPDEPPPRKLSRLKKDFTNAVGAKWNENHESAEAERYFHGIQWSKENLKTLQERGQPPITFNRVKRKINTITGIIERMRQGPKAYARNPQRQAEDGAEIATKVLKYALGWDWPDTSAAIARRACVRGLAGVELVLAQGDQADPEIQWDEVDQRDYFYDARSVKPDFSDARFMGTTRWVDLDEAVENWPEHAEELESYVERNPTSELDRGDERFHTQWCDAERKRIRIIDHWFMKGSSWYYVIYCSDTFLEWGPTYLKDERGRDTHKFEMISYEIDQDGDRYGAIRDLKSPQDEVNQRRSKGLHQLHSRKVVADAGAVDDVDVARREYARADGWVVKNPGKEIITEDAQAAQVVEGNFNLLQEAKAEIDTFGPNPGLVGVDIPADSGRAIQLLQAAGIAELGSFMANYKHWKLRVYRKTWNACQQIWQEPRWIRVTDDENLAQFVQVNGLQKDPATGNLEILNQLSALDVDIIFDDSESALTTMQDTFDTLVALGQGGAQVPPEMFIELSPLPSSTKQRIMQQIAAAQQPKPMDVMAMQLQLGLLQAQIQDLQAKAEKNLADAQKTMVEAQNPQGPAQQIDTPADLAKADLDQAKAQEIRHKIEVGTHVPAAPEQQPGLFEVNQAKALEHAARADLARSQAQLGQQDTWQKFDLNLADQDLKRSQTLVSTMQAAKLAEEAQTIRDAPEGMLQKPPPRPTSVPSVGK